MASRVRNWGRWGDDDELGTLNYITPAKIGEAARLAEKGRVIPLGIPVSTAGPLGAYGSRRNPLHVMTETGLEANIAALLGEWNEEDHSDVSALLRAGPARFCDDLLMMHLHSVSHWDALAHCHYDGTQYNGYPAEHTTSLGATKNSVARMARGGQVVSRGVLLDVARHRGLPWLAPGTAIEPDELEEAAAAQNVHVEAGDVLMVRTGAWRFFQQTRDRAAWAVRHAGLSWRCAQWLHDNEVAAVAADNLAVEAHDEESLTLSTSDRDRTPPFLLHMLCLRDMGLTLGELWNLEDLAAACEADGRYACLLVAQPLEIVGGSGGPVNPLAVR